MLRREFVKRSGSGILILFAGAGVLLESACNASDWLQEASNILTLIGPLGDGALAIVEIADPAAAIGLAAVDKLYDAAWQTLSKFLADEAAALKSSQPGAVTQLGAFVTSLNADAAQLASAVLQVKDPTALAQAQTLTSAITGEIAAIMAVIPKVVSTQGNMTLRSLGAAPKSYRTAKSLRGQLVKQLREETGVPELDARRILIAKQLSALDLK